jgi:hypothetical protein
MAKLGRPTNYTPEIAAALLAGLEEGKSLSEICRKTGMPGRSTVHRWLTEPQHAEFRDRYARSRDIGLDVMADQLLKIASTPKVGKTKKTTPNGVEITEGDMVAHRRLMVDTMKWYLSKLAPRRYGDRLELAGSVAFDRAGALKRARDRSKTGEGEGGPE